MNNIQIFKSPEFGVIRTVSINGEPWLVGKDVAQVLGYQNASKALSDHVDAEDKLNNESLLSLGQRGGWLVNESGLYSLVLSSKLPGAKKFKRWFTSEVLPAIRKNGAYMTPETLQAAILNPDYLLQVVTALKDETDRRKALEAANSRLTVDNQIMQPKAEYFDEIVERNLLTSFRETAKELGIPQKKFVAFLLDYRYIYRDKKGKLMPYAGKGDGLFEVKECFNEKTQWSGTQTLVTPKGRETFRLLLAVLEARQGRSGNWGGMIVLGLAALGGNRGGGGAAMMAGLKIRGILTPVCELALNDTSIWGWLRMTALLGLA